MKGLLVYQSKHGTTEKVAQRMQNLLGEEYLIININTTSLPKLSEFDRIVIGGSIHAGAIQKKIQAFCKLNLDLLLQKEIGLFLSCMYKEDSALKQLETAFPESLIKHAKATAITGGEFLFSEMNWIEKIIVRKIVGVKESRSEINFTAIDDFIAHMTT